MINPFGTEAEKIKAKIWSFFAAKNSTIKNDDELDKLLNRFCKLQPKNQVIAEGILFEKFAVIEHLRWAGWQKYLHSKCTKDNEGNLIIPVGYVKRLERLIKTSYRDLTEKEKTFDREEVKKYWSLIHKCKEKI